MEIWLAKERVIVRARAQGFQLDKQVSCIRKTRTAQRERGCREEGCVHCVQGREKEEAKAGAGKEAGKSFEYECGWSKLT